MRYLLIVLLLTASSTQAQIYTYTDDQGNRVFTDRRQGQAVPSTPTNTMAAPVSQPAPQQRQENAPEAPFFYQTLHILSPAAETSVHHAGGELTITVASDPELQPEHRFQAVLNGQAYGEVSAQPVFTLSNIDRGTHQLAVDIVDAEGTALQRTEALPVHIHRPSLAQKRRINPCKYEDFGKRPECPLKDRPVKQPRRFWFLPFT